MSSSTAPRRLIPSGRTPAAIIRSHVPSITARIDDLASDADPHAWDEDGDYIGSMRECPCGVILDGFYAYADHLADVLTRELLGVPAPKITGAFVSGPKITGAFVSADRYGGRWTDLATVETIADILWPNGDLDAEWGADTLDEIASAMVNAGMHPEDVDRTQGYAPPASFSRETAFGREGDR